MVRQQQSSAATLARIDGLEFATKPRYVPGYA